MNLVLYQNLSSWYFHLQGQISFHILSFLDGEELKPAGPQAWVEEAFGVDIDLVLQVLELQVQVKSDALLEIYWRKTPLKILKVLPCQPCSLEVFWRWGNLLLR